MDWVIVVHLLMGVNIRFVLASSLMLFASLYQSPIYATSIHFLSIEELSRSSYTVVRGTVRSIEYRLVDDGRKIVTLVVLDVLEQYKGDGLQNAEVVLPGGEYGEIGQRISGVPVFLLGQEVLLFLDLFHPGVGATYPVRFTPNSMGLGAFVIDDDSVALRQVQGLEIFAGPLKAPKQLMEDEGAPSLKELESRIRNALREDVRE